MSGSTNIVMIGVKEFKDAVDRMLLDFEAVTRDAVAEGISVIQRQAMDNASGRPGPNVVSGELRRSIKTEGPARVAFGTYLATAGPSTVYGRRIELGFTGVDSLGRHYNQPPFPFLGPAVKRAREEVLPMLFERKWAEAAKRAGR